MRPRPSWPPVDKTLQALLLQTKLLALSAPQSSCGHPGSCELIPGVGRPAGSIGQRDGRGRVKLTLGGVARPCSAAAALEPFLPALRSGCSPPVSTSAHHPARSRRPSAASGGRLTVSRGFLAIQVSAQRKPLVGAFDRLLRQTVNFSSGVSIWGCEVPLVWRAQLPYGSITCKHLRGDGRRFIFLLGVQSTGASMFG